MSSISNRFFVSTIDDGTTLHGNLSSDKALTQAWGSDTAIPDWTVASAQPTIYLTLLSGNDLEQPESNSIVWLYNNVVIQFDANGTSTNPLNLFQKTTHNVTVGGTTKAMPALKIIGNLAGYQGNVDMDTITLRGTCNIDASNGIDFSVTTQVRISSVSASGYLGVINFVDGVSDITRSPQTLKMFAKLYGGDSGGEVSSFTTKWYLNAQAQETAGTTIDGIANSYSLSDKDVVDHATVRCEFYIGTDIKYTAYVGVDDMQDPEFMYIQYNGANGNAASLHEGNNAAFTIWVGTRDDSSVLGGASSPTFNYIDVRLLDGDAAVITGSLGSGIPADVGNGFRPLTMSQGKGSITIPYDVAKNQGKKNLTGVVYAYTTKPRP